MIIRRTNLGYDSIFPQANDIYKVLDMLGLISKEKIDGSVILQELRMTSERQIHYYKKACSYLGLIDSEDNLTAIGRLIVDQSAQIQVQIMVYLILSNEIFKTYYNHRNKEETIIQIESNYNYNRTTSKRRFNTLEQWIKWCDIVIKDYEIEVCIYL